MSFEIVVVCDLCFVKVTGYDSEEKAREAAQKVIDGNYILWVESLGPWYGGANHAIQVIPPHTISRFEIKPDVGAESRYSHLVPGTISDK